MIECPLIMIEVLTVLTDVDTVDNSLRPLRHKGIGPVVPVQNSREVCKLGQNLEVGLKRTPNN